LVEIVNIVGSGELENKLDLLSLFESIQPPLVKYDPEMYHALYMFFDEDDSPTITVYTSGKYIIVGAETIEELQDSRKRFLDILHKNGQIDCPKDIWFDIQNIVGAGTVEMELDLNQIVVALGFENAEYDPENFPGVVYRDSENDCVVLVFRTGNIVITGATSFESVEHAFQDFCELLPNG
jgi:transcription initiation factor TFIID TATA-box-binding protein